MEKEQASTIEARKDSRTDQKVLQSDLGPTEISAIHQFNRSQRPMLNCDYKITKNEEMAPGAESMLVVNPHLHGSPSEEKI